MENAVESTRVIESERERWQFREIDSARTPGAPRPRSLVCEGSMIVRRLWQYPADWRQLPEAELLRLFDISEDSP